jgi:hypothetical protein
MHPDTCRTLLACYKAEGNSFTGQVMIGDKSWVYHFQLKLNKKMRSVASPFNTKGQK